MLNECSYRSPRKAGYAALGEELLAVAKQLEALGERAAARQVSAAARVMFRKRHPVIARLMYLGGLALSAGFFAMLAITVWQLSA